MLYTYYCNTNYGFDINMYLISILLKRHLQMQYTSTLCLI